MASLVRLTFCVGKAKMEKIKLEIVGISHSHTQSGAYALILSENSGGRRLPIIIGGFEAQAIALELEKIVPTRPLTHDLFKNVSESFEINVKEILIYRLQEGIFFSKIICEREGKTQEIDARTSDAVAIGVRFNCPIFTYESILSSAGIMMDETQIDESDEFFIEEEETTIEVSVEELKQQLEDAIMNEEYEKASKLRDEIKRRENK